MSQLPDKLPIVPFSHPVRGTVVLPGSKSITNRALILAALSPHTVKLYGTLFSRDTYLMIAALQDLGFKVTSNHSEHTITIGGQGGKIPVKEARINIGNAGTAARFLTAFVCLQPGGLYHFDGDAAMRRRPIGALLEALESQNAQATARTFPFSLRTAGLAGGEVLLDATESSQLLSALLLISRYAKQPLSVKLKSGTVSRPFVTMTEEMVKQFASNPTNYVVECDATAASYFLALPLINNGALNLPDYSISHGLQGDTQFASIMKQVGLRVMPFTHDAGTQVWRSQGTKVRGVTADFNEFSDTFLTLAAIAPLLDGPTKITGIAHTRKQETDRVAGMARELTKLGQEVIETEDSLEIHPRPLRSGVEIETYHDHRFAMSFGVLGCHDLNRNGRPWLTIKDPACCSKTFPHFFDVLASLRAESQG